MRSTRFVFDLVSNLQMRVTYIEVFASTSKIATSFTYSHSWKLVNPRRSRKRLRPLGSGQRKGAKSEHLLGYRWKLVYDWYSLVIEWMNFLLTWLGMYLSICLSTTPPGSNFTINHLQQFESRQAPLLPRQARSQAIYGLIQKCTHPKI